MNNLQTQQELMQAYWGPGGTVDMVKEYNAKHGCDVKPWECVKHVNEDKFDAHPQFAGKPWNYTFALTILYDDKRKEHRPVFVGDKLWNGQHWVVIEFDLYVDNLTWNQPKPKRTFKLEFTEEERRALMCLTSMSQSHVLVDLHNKFTASARDKE